MTDQAQRRIDHAHPARETNVSMNYGFYMPNNDIDTITRCAECRKLVGARWTDRGWRTYQHKDAHGEPYCPGGGQTS